MKNVLRMKVGEDVRINDGQGTTYLCCLNRYEKDQAVLDVFRKLDTETELPSEIILFQGLPKTERFCERPVLPTFVRSIPSYRLSEVPETK